MNHSASTTTGIRIGQGIDVHAFGDGDHLMLGGVRVAHDQGVIATSDGPWVERGAPCLRLGTRRLVSTSRRPIAVERRDSRAFCAIASLLRERGLSAWQCRCPVLCERPYGPPRGDRAVIARRARFDIDAISGQGHHHRSARLCGLGEGKAAEAV